MSELQTYWSLEDVKLEFFESNSTFHRTMMHDVFPPKFVGHDVLQSNRYRTRRKGYRRGLDVENVL